MLYDIETMAELPLGELELRASELAVHAQSVIDNAQLSGRDISADESRVVHRDKDELESLRAAIALREQHDRQHAERSALLGSAIETRSRRDSRLSPIMCSAGNLEMLEQARREYRSLSVIEERSALDTSALGTAVEYGPSGLLAPLSLWRASAIPTSEPPQGYAATVPLFDLPAGTTLVNESTPHAEFDSVTPDSVQLGRTGAWSDLSAEANISTSLTEIQAAHARIIARDADVALLAKLENSDCGLDIDTALVTVAAEVAADVSQLWVVGDPAAIASLAGNAVFAVTNAADIASYAVAYGGARLYPTPAASAGALTVFHPQSFRCFATRMANGVVVDPTSGQQRFGSWLLLGFGQTLVGSALTVGGGS